MELQGIYVQVHDFLNWMTECERNAKSEELGKDLDHVQILRHDFHHFALRTVAYGSRQVWSICDQCDSLVALDHPESYTVSMWRDEISEAWENVLELIDTRIQVLEANYAWHVYMYKCRCTLAAAVDKIQQWSTYASRENLEPEHSEKIRERMRADLISLKPMIKNVEREYKSMDRCYSGDHLAEIQARASDVSMSWKQMKNIFKEGGSGESLNNQSTNQLLKFLNRYANLRRSIDDVQARLRGWPEETELNKEQIEKLLSDHQALKKVIAARERQLEMCTNYGSAMISQQHFASTDVEDKLLSLNKDWVQLMHLWEQRFEKVHKMLLKSARSLDDLSKQGSSMDVHVKNDQSHVASTTSLNESQKPKKAMTTSNGDANFRGGMYASSPNVLFQDQQGESSRSEPVTREDPSRNHSLTNGASTEMLSYEGILFRKRLQTRRDHIAIEGGWKRFYCVLKDRYLYFYSDKVNKEKGKLSKKYPPLPLAGSTVRTDVQHGRLRNLFTVRPLDDVEYLFQARDEHHMDGWVRFITQSAEGPLLDKNGQLGNVESSSKTMLLLKRASPRIFQNFFQRKKPQNGAIKLA